MSQSEQPQVRASPFGLQLRFLTLMLPVFLLATAISFSFIAKHSFGDERSLLTSRIGNLAARAGSAVSKLPKDAAPAQLDTILSLLLADQAVICAKIMTADRSILATAPPRRHCAGTGTTVSVPLAKSRGGTLQVSYNLQELEARSDQFRSFSYLAVLGALVVAAVSGAFAFRMIVGQPIKAMLRAIRLTRASGRSVTVENVPKDELGVVISAFNDMQEEIARKADDVEKSLRHLDRLYNETPAMMFSIDDQGRIASASGHWLEHAGYLRHDILNHPAQSFLLPLNKSASADMFGPDCAIRDMPFKLLCKDGTSRDVLLNAVPDTNKTKLCVLSDITSLKAAERELQKQALTDHLTGLPNRKGLFEYLAHLETQPDRQAAILFIDLDNFKTINDTLGHEAGDLLLQAATGRLRNAISKQDLLARLGGDEFAIVLNDLHEQSDAAGVAARIVSAFSRPFRLGEATGIVGTSIGIAPIQPGQSGDEALRLADLAMYEAKQSGKNCVATYSSGMQAKVMARDLLARKIRDGLLNNSFEFFLQPILNIQEMKPVGAEALLRLRCPKDGMISPAEIIQVAEETGLIKQITALSVAHGMELAENLRCDKQAPCYIAINISAHQVNTDFASELASMLHARPEISKRLVLEITETALFRSGEDAANILAKLRRTGCRIALDDFGTGYSSLAHLHRFPVDIIKLDRSFVGALAAGHEASRRSRALVKATAAMAGELGIEIVAEGIEDQDSLELLRSFGVKYGQGYLFSPPLPQPAWMSWMTAFGAKPQPQAVSVEAGHIRALA